MSFIEDRMRNFFVEQFSTSGLLGNFVRELKAFIREEVALAKKEMTEKFSSYRRHAPVLAIGGSVAYAGLIVLVGSIGFLLAYGFQKLGFDSTLAMFMGAGIVGLVAMTIGAALAIKGARAIARITPVPERALETLTGQKRTTNSSPQKKMDDLRSPQELQWQALRTKERVREEGKELKHRATPTGLKEMAIHHLKTHKLAWGATALGSVVAVGGLIAGRRLLKTQPPFAKWFRP